MPLTKKRKLAMLADTPYLKHVKLELDSETISELLEDATAASQQTEAAEFVDYKQLRNVPQLFYEYANMSVQTFDLLLCKIGHRMGGNRTNFVTPAIRSDLRLILTLRWLITSDSHRSLANRFGVGRTTSADIVHEVCSAICDVLCEEYLPTPTRAQWSSIADNFYRRTGFPNCLGILEGVNTTFALRDNRQRTRNTNSFMFMLLETIIDDSGRLVTTEIRTAAPQDEGLLKSKLRLFRVSEAELCWKLNFPLSTRLPNSDAEAPYVLLADDRFPATTPVLKPAVSNAENGAELFNAKLELTKKGPVNIFKKMMNRWMVLKRPMTCSETVARTMLQAISILHNFILAHDGLENLTSVPEPRDKWQGVNFSVVDDHSAASDFDATSVRGIFQNYFVAQEEQLHLSTLEM